MTRRVAGRAAAAGAIAAIALTIVRPSAASPAPGQQPTFLSRLEAVRVDVSVTRRGVPVTGLTAADFEILDNGVRQDVQLMPADAVPIDLVMALDVSGSVTGERLARLRDASQAALGTLGRDDRAALLTFNHRVAVRTPLTADFASIGAALVEEPEPGQTSMIDAAYAALVHADAGRGRGLAIVLSDGVDTMSWLTAASVMDTARHADAVLYGVSADAAPARVLDDLAQASGGDLIRLQSAAQLSSALRRIVETFRQRYLLSYVPRGVARGGWHTLTVRARGSGLAVKSRAGYFGS